ncbi:MAG TPA: hypothetical protein VK906_08075 [Egicoccus sp.]|nr:hypothetical protein [Egicoccus sp.]HSK23116.1 hypothetical protein [Egicoccus sp.]
MDRVVLVGLALVAVVGLIAWAQYAYRQRLQASLASWMAREPALAPTTTPVGLAPGQLADGFHGCPRGDRRYGLRWGVEGPLDARIDGRDVTVPCAAFEWWWEERRQHNDGKGHTTTSYVTRRVPVAAVRLPSVVPDQVHIGPETVFGRIGISRSDHQLESDAFNRRFRVLAQDRLLTVQLLDAGLQELLLSRFTGRTIELLGDLLLLSGDPGRRDERLVGAVGTLPPVREDAAALLAGMPAQFWRAIDAGREG